MCECNNLVGIYYVNVYNIIFEHPTRVVRCGDGRAWCRRGVYNILRIYGIYCNIQTVDE